MKKILLFLFVFVCANAFAQPKATYKTGYYCGLETSPYYLPKIIGISDSNVYSVRIHTMENSIWIEKFNSTKYARQNNIKVKINKFLKGDFKIKGAVFVKEKLYVFLVGKDKKDKFNIKLYAVVVDQETLKPTMEAKVLCSIPVTTIPEYDFCSMLFAQGNQKLGVIIGGRRAARDLFIKTCVFDQDLNVTSEKDAELRNVSESKFGLGHEKIYPNGDILAYCVTKTTLEKRFNSVVHFNADKNELAIIKVSAEKDFLDDLMAAKDHTGVIRLMALFTKNGTHTSGFGYAVLNGEKELSITNRMFSEKLLKAFSSNTDTTDEATEDSSIPYLQIHDVMVDKQNNVLLQLEQSVDKPEKYVATMSNGSKIIKYRPVHYRKSILLMSFNEKGEVNWEFRIPKNQRSIRDMAYYSSFITLSTGDYFVFYYNDSPLSSWDFSFCKTQEYFNACESMAEIDAKTGIPVRGRRVVSKSEDKCKIIPMTIFYINDSTALVYEA